MAARKRKPRKPADIDTRVAFEPSVRVQSEWTLTQVRLARISADSGNLSQAARLCEWLMSDDRVFAALNTRVQALLGLDPTFEASGDKRRSNRAVKALDAGQDWWASYPEDEVALILKWGLMLGIGPAQHQWPQEPDHGNRWLPVPRFWHPQHFRYDTIGRVWKTWISTEGISGQTREIEVVPGDGQWLLHCPYGKNRPWAWGMCWPLARLVVLKHQSDADWDRVGEKEGLLVISAALEDAMKIQGYSKETRQQICTDLYNRGRNAVAALMPGLDVKSVASGVNANELYKPHIDLLNTAIAIVIRGGNLGTETKGGSLAAIESQERTGDLANLRFDAQSWTTTAHDQSLVHWAEFNYGDRKLAPWPVYPVEPDEDLVAKTESDERAFANADRAEKLGFVVDRQAFLDEHKIGWCKPGERPPEPEPPKPDDENGTDQNPDGTGDELAEVARGDDSGGGDAGDGSSGADAPPGQERNGDAQPQGRSAAFWRLLSGGAASESPGFLDGQLYTDALTKRAAKAGTDAIQPDVERILEALLGAEDYEDLQRRLDETFDDLEPEELAELTERVKVLAELAGRAAVIRDY